MIERSKRIGVDTGDIAALLSLELIASLAAYNRAPLADHPGGDRGRRPDPRRRSCATPTGLGSGRRR